MRSLLLRSALLTTFVALALYGCSGDGDPAQPAPQTGGSAGVGGTGATGGGGSGGDGGTGGGGGTVPDGSTGGTGGTGLPDGSTDDGDAACQHTMVTATPAPAELFIMADRSGSMSGQKWTDLQQGLQDFFNLPASQGTYAALSFFPLDDGCAPSEGTCAGGAYVKPLVNWGELPANAAALNAAVQAATSNGCFTPTQEALNGLLLGSKDRQVQMPGHQVAAVFLSDGEPCCGDCPCEDNTCIGGLVTPFAQGTPAIQTYAIYLDSAAKGVMDSIALAGGTNAAYDGGGGAATVVAAFEDIKSRMVHCKFSRG